MQHLSSIYTALLVWAQNTNSVRRLHLSQKRSLRIMFFQSRNPHTGPLFNVSNFFKSFDKTALKNYIFISISLKGLLPPSFNNWFKFSLSHTRMKMHGKILVIVKYSFTVLKPMVDFQCL